MFPSSMISTGGDEVQTTCYDNDEETQRDLNATGRTLNEALTDFVHGTHGALVDAGKTPVVWEGMYVDLVLVCAMRARLRLIAMRLQKWFLISTCHCRRTLSCCM